VNGPKDAGYEVGVFGHVVEIAGDGVKPPPCMVAPSEIVLLRAGYEVEPSDCAVFCPGTYFSRSLTESGHPRTKLMKPALGLGEPRTYVNQPDMGASHQRHSPGLRRAAVTTSAKQADAPRR
jgi:hypothetical protein